jgi:hypothetical protein
MTTQADYPHKASIREIIKLAWDLDLWASRSEDKHALAVIKSIRAELDLIESNINNH